MVWLKRGGLLWGFGFPYSSQLPQFLGHPPKISGHPNPFGPAVGVPIKVPVRSPPPPLFPTKPKPPFPPQTTHPDANPNPKYPTPNPNPKLQTPNSNPPSRSFPGEAYSDGRSEPSPLGLEGFGGLGFGVWGWGFRVWGLGLGIWGLGFTAFGVFA